MERTRAHVLNAPLLLHYSKMLFQTMCRKNRWGLGLGWVALPAGYGYSALIWLLACEVGKGNIPVVTKNMNKTNSRLTKQKHGSAQRTQFCCSRGTRWRKGEGQTNGANIERAHKDLKRVKPCMAPCTTLTQAFHIHRKQISRSKWNIVPGWPASSTCGCPWCQPPRCAPCSWGRCSCVRCLIPGFGLKRRGR